MAGCFCHHPISYNSLQQFYCSCGINLVYKLKDALFVACVIKWKFVFLNELLVFVPVLGIFI
jgi:hypothetical protein